MDFGLTEEQRLIVETTRAFVENELYPHEAEVERTGVLRPELIAELQGQGDRGRALRRQHAGGGRRRRARYGDLAALREGARPRQLCAALDLRGAALEHPAAPAREEQREKYLYPCIRGEKWDCLAMTEPGAGSDLRGMKATAVQDGDDWVLNGTKHFISHADIADFAIVFMASGEEDTPRGKRKKITAFFVDKGTQGFTVRDGYRNVSHRGYTNAILEFDDCRLPASQVLGEVHKGFEVANHWLGATRLQVGATCLGRAERALGHAIDYAAQREQFGQQIGKFQGVSFKLADMAMELKAAELMILEAGWKYDAGTVTDQDMAMAKLKATEMLAFVADEAIQIHGGMGLMDELPLERIWRDARVERIWEGTSEIQRHIISRALLRAVGG